MAKNEEIMRTASFTDVEPPQGSPIIIGGGGAGSEAAVYCKFKARDYAPQSRGSRTRFVNSDNRSMLKLQLTINDVLLDLSSLLATNDFEIEVRCIGSDNDLEFFLEPQAVEFNQKTYPQSPEPGPEGLDVFQSQDSFASRVKIRLQGVEIKRELSRTDKFTLKADII